MGLRSKSRSAVTLIELLCVMAIISILASMLVPTCLRAYQRVRGMSQEWDAASVAELIVKQSRGYCTTHPRYQFVSKADFVKQCGFSPKCKDWIQASSSEFYPFDYADPTNKVVLYLPIGSKKQSGYLFTKGDLTLWPVEQ